jgi:very-short-patch-repair endonuclease
VKLGLVTTTQLRQLRLTAPQIRWLVVHGPLIPHRKHVYRLAGVPISWEQAVLAAALSAGEKAVISHGTAAAVWNLRHSDRFEAGIHVTSDRRVRIDGVSGHVTRLTSAERTSHGPIPITSPERTVIDLAGTLTAKQLGQCVDDAIRRGLVDLERLRRLVAPAAGTRGVKALHKVLADRIPGYRPDDSDFETKMNRMWDDLGLPPAKRQHRVSIDGHSYRLDRAIVECKIGTEWDSYRYHSAPSDRDYDSNRRARLAGDGWFIIPVTANAEPELVARAVLRAYRDRSETGGPRR